MPHRWQHAFTRYLKRPRRLAHFGRLPPQALLAGPGPPPVLPLPRPRGGIAGLPARQLETPPSNSSNALAQSIACAIGMDP